MIIVNRGACRRENIELIGLSTSRNDPTKIGQFGSGTAYALVAACRLGMKVRLSSADERGPYTVEPWVHPDTGRVHLRYEEGSSVWALWQRLVGRPKRSVATSFHKDFGVMDWTTPFQVVREFVTNARDAAPDKWAVAAVSSLADFIASVEGDATVVEILDHRADEVHSNWWKYFTLDPTEHPDLEGEPQAVLFTSGRVSVLQKAEIGELALFNRGVRVPWPSAEAPQSMYDYVCDISLTEARTIGNTYAVVVSCELALGAYMNSSRVVCADILNRVAENHKLFEATFDMGYSNLNASAEVLSSVVGTREIGGREQAVTSSYYPLPSGWAAPVRDALVVKDRDGDFGFKEDFAVSVGARKYLAELIAKHGDQSSGCAHAIYELRLGHMVSSSKVPEDF